MHLCEVRKPAMKTHPVLLVPLAGKVVEMCVFRGRGSGQTRCSRILVPPALSEEAAVVAAAA